MPLVGQYLLTHLFYLVFVPLVGQYLLTHFIQDLCHWLAQCRRLTREMKWAWHSLQGSIYTFHHHQHLVLFTILHLSPVTCVERNQIDANIQYLQFLRPLVWRRKTIIGKLQTVCAVWSFPRGWLQKKVMVFIAFFVLIATLPALEKGWKLSVGAMFWKQEFFKGFPLEWLWICICYHYLLDDKWKGAVTPQVLAWHDVQYILLYPRTELFTM